MVTTFTLVLAVLAASPEDRGWIPDVCSQIRAVRLGVEVGLTGYADPDLKALMEEKFRTSASITLRSAGISIVEKEDPFGALVISVELQKVFDTGVTTYNVAVRRYEGVVVGRNRALTLAIVAESRSSGVAGLEALPNSVREAIGEALNDFIGCVLAARDKAGELKPVKAPKKKPIGAEGDK